MCRRSRSIPKATSAICCSRFQISMPSDFRPWIDESEAARKGMSPDEFADDQADLWRKGLWPSGTKAQSASRNFVDAAEARDLHARHQRRHPGHRLEIVPRAAGGIHGRPRRVCEQIASAASGLLALLGIDADPVRSREHIFLRTDREAWQEGRDLDLPQLIQRIQRPPFDKMGVVDLDSFYAAKTARSWR